MSPFFSRVGSASMDIWQSTLELLAFIGEASIVFIKFIVGKASYRRTDLSLFIQQCGADALPIVTLISLLVGLILAFIGAVQLMMFGAQVYVADLVGIAMVRVMGAVMVGIVMAGRTGAAFAAQLGTMQGNEEIDALKTMGVSPMEFLVLPRMLALVLMMPLLCIYADLMGVLGGLIVGVGVLDIGLLQYIKQTTGALKLSYFIIGIIHATYFRRAGVPGRMSQGNAVRPKCFGCGGCNHLGGGHLDCGHHRRHRAHHSGVQYSRDLRWKVQG